MTFKTGDIVLVLPSATGRNVYNGPIMRPVTGKEVQMGRAGIIGYASFEETEFVAMWEDIILSTSLILELV